MSEEIVESLVTIGLCVFPAEGCIEGLYKSYPSASGCSPLLHVQGKYKANFWRIQLTITLYSVTVVVTVSIYWFLICSGPAGAGARQPGDGSILCQVRTNIFIMRFTSVDYHTLHSCFVKASVHEQCKE